MSEGVFFFADVKRRECRDLDSVVVNGVNNYHCVMKGRERGRAEIECDMIYLFHVSDILLWAATF